MENTIAIFIFLIPILIFTALSAFFLLYGTEIRENIIKKAFKDAIIELYKHNKE